MFIDIEMILCDMKLYSGSRFYVVVFLFDPITQRCNWRRAGRGLPGMMKSAANWMAELLELPGQLNLSIKLGSRNSECLKHFYPAERLSCLPARDSAPFLFLKKWPYPALDFLRVFMNIRFISLQSYSNFLLQTLYSHFRCKKSRTYAILVLYKW
jgi:hypothetical protein